MADLKMALELDTGEYWAHIGRWICCDEFLGESNRALDEYNAAVELAPQEPDAYYHRGLYYLWHEEWEAAISDMDEAISRGVYWPDPYVHRGDAYREMGWVDEARADYETFLAMIPGELESEYSDWIDDIVQWLGENL